MNLPSHSEQEFVSPEYISNKLGFHPNTVRAWANGGKGKPENFPTATKIGNRWLFNLKEVKNFFDNLSS